MAAAPTPPAAACVHELVAAQAARTPDATAVIFEAAAMTYAELVRRANRLARRLAAAGVARGDLVAVELERGLALPVALLGILTAGAAYVPLDPQAPAARRARVLRAAGARVLVVDAAARPGTAAPDEPGLRRVALDACGGDPDARPGGGDALDAPVAAGARPTDLMYVLFTSGTTGEPKGVMLEHAGIANLLDWMARAYGFTARDRILQKTPYTFDASVWELFLPLVTGGAVIEARPGGHRDPRYLVEAVAAHGATTLQLVPSMLRHVVEEPGLGACGALRHVFSGGEALTRELVDRWFAVSSLPLHNLYGPTEASVQVLTWTCRPGDARADVPIGAPIDGAIAHVLDEAGREVPAGEPGELYLGGVALARGYLGDPALTASRFVADPARGRLYRTGDRVRRHADGTLEFLGRLDDQVKIQGFRIELGEIEARLRELPRVRNAAAIVEHDTATGRTQLVAYLEASAAELSLRGVREQLARHLPDYMIPTQIRVAPALPLSAHGKLDKGKLRQLRATPLTAESEGEAEAARERPRSALEQELCEIWSGLLGVGSVGVADDFFELGGDSITGLLVIARAKQRGISLTAEDLFRLRRIDEIAVAATRRAAPGN